ncbi:hypothetical protein SELMODRAFT_419932 [Selaginella moellendorffii]|uniref:F-box domain-containing protein n=1 Tax=Selaginella moellendorffii TaxID=88036 RepID=D8SA16_SELML|nr:hypothetical protein SELMODRAFT_419932 [Selaginella moellendorffii]
MDSVELLQDVEASDELLDSRINILEFVPLSTIGGEDQGGSDLRFHTWALVLNTPKGQFLVWNKNRNSCRISRILIACHWKNRVASDGGPLVALWSMRRQLIVLDVSTGMACICPSPPELVTSSSSSLVLSTSALGSSLDKFQLLVVYSDSALAPQDSFLITSAIFDPTTGMWRVKSRYSPGFTGRETTMYGDSRWPGYSALAGGFLHVMFCEPSSWWNTPCVRYDLERDEWCREPVWTVKWSQGQVKNMRVHYSEETWRINADGLPQALVNLQPPLEAGVANITRRSDGVFLYAFFTCQGCVEIVYIHDFEAGIWYAHRYRRLRDLLKLKPVKSLDYNHGENVDGQKWSNLPTDLLQQVAQLLCTVRDIRALSMVFHNWRRTGQRLLKRYQEPALVFWNKKHSELCLFRSDKGWSRMIRDKNFAHRAPLVTHGPLLISWEGSTLYVTNVLKKIFSTNRVMAPSPEMERILRVACISQEKLLVIFFTELKEVAPAVVSFNNSTRPQWQVGNSRRGIATLTPVETFFNERRLPWPPADECGARDAENVILLGPYAYFMLDRVVASQRQTVFQYNWESDEWVSQEQVQTPCRDCHDFCAYSYQFHVKCPLIQLNGRPAIVRPTMEIWFLADPGGKCIAKIPQETWEKLIQVLDTSYEYTYLWAVGNITAPRIVVVSVHQCTTSVHMVCSIRNTLVAIIVWEFVLGLWDVIPYSNREDRLWLKSKYFAVCLEQNSVVMKHLLRRSWFEFPTVPWHLRSRDRRFIEPYILSRAMEI